MGDLKRTVLVAGGAIASLLAARWALRQQNKSSPLRTVRPESEPARRVLILGAGFGGLYSAVRIADALRDQNDTEVLLVDRHNYHLFTPMLTQVAGSAVEPRSVAFPVRRLLRDHRLSVRRSEVRAIDLAARRVVTGDGDLAYDKLVVALGSVSNFFGIDAVERYGYPFKSMSDAIGIRNHIVDCFERAANSSDEAERKRLLTIVVVGGGPTGVELAASLHDFIHHTLIAGYPNISFQREVRIVLCEAQGRVLPTLGPDLAREAAGVLRRKAVEVLSNTSIERVWDGGIATQDGREIPTSTLVWVAGVKANPVVAALDLPKGRAGAVVVDECLRVPGVPGVYALGDSAAYTDPSNHQPLPADAKVAIQQAVTVAENVVRELRGEEPRPFAYRGLGEMVSLGTNAAVANVLGFRLSGALAWLVWRTFYLGRLRGLESKFRVLGDWALGALFGRYTAEIELPPPVEAAERVA